MLGCALATEARTACGGGNMRQTDGQGPVCSVDVLTKVGAATEFGVLSGTKNLMRDGVVVLSTCTRWGRSAQRELVPIRTPPHLSLLHESEAARGSAAIAAHAPNPVCYMCTFAQSPGGHVTRWPAIAT